MHVHLCAGFLLLLLPMLSLLPMLHLLLRQLEVAPLLFRIPEHEGIRDWPWPTLLRSLLVLFIRSNIQILLLRPISLPHRHRICSASARVHRGHRGSIGLQLESLLGRGCRRSHMAGALRASVEEGDAHIAHRGVTPRAPLLSRLLSAHAAGVFRHRDVVPR